MSYTPAEEKLFSLAKANPIMQSYFQGAGAFRWFGRQLAQGDVQQGTCLRYHRVSTVRPYYMGGISSMSQPRFQLDIVDLDPVRARQAKKAVIDFLGTIALSQAAQFGSPITSPTQAPNFVLNERAGMDYQLKPPAYVETVDVRFFNEEMIPS